MGRLFWKFFFFIWLAQLTAISGIAATFWFEHRNFDKMRLVVDHGYAATSLVKSAEAALQSGGTGNLRRFLENQDPSLVYAVDENNIDLLGRHIEPELLGRARSNFMNDPDTQSIRQVRSEEGHSYLIFLPILGDFSFKSVHVPNGPRLPEEFHIPVEPMVAAILASLIFAAFLARYFSKPIRSLRSAFEAATTGNLVVHLGNAMGKRRDELADLGRYFDRMAEHLRSLMDGQRRLLHDVSHEMRSPLARLQIALGLIRQQPEKLTTYLDRIQRESDRMDQLVGEILTISRLEAGVVSSMDEEFDLDELISDVISDARFESADSGHSVDFSDGVNSIVRGNAELLHRAIENIVRNAVRHTPAGTNVSIEARLMSDAPKILLQISDQGPGIPEKDLASIFDPFFRGSRLKTSDGHGLGLAFAKRVIEAHGGTISASNRRGGGLCIEIVLPVKLP